MPDKLRVCSFGFRKLFPVFLTWLLINSFSSGCYGMSRGSSSVLEVQAKATSEPETISEESVFSLIYQGKFSEAKQKLELEKSSGRPTPYYTDQLLLIITKYEILQKEREISKAKEYTKKLTELDKLQKAADVNGLSDINDVSDILATVFRTYEFCDENQKEQLRSRPFIENVIEKSKARAADYEAKGNWLDSYIHCNSLLKAIDEDNQLYADHAEELLTKANIVAFFQDSPCETSRERYDKIESRMLTRAIDTLDFNYVSEVDYREMAVNAVKRSELLAVVMKESYNEIIKSENPSLKNSNGESYYMPLDDNALMAWSSSLAMILNEVNDSPLGIDKKKFIKVFEKVLALNDTTVQLPRQILIAQFSEAALETLDPYTVMIWPKQVEDFEKNMNNKFTGIGIHIGKKKGWLTATSLLPDTPAYNSGLDAGDVIEKVDGVETKNMSLNCAIKRITGPAGTDVVLTIRRPGKEKTFDITITRAAIIVPTVSGWKRDLSGQWLYMIDDKCKIGYVRLSSFSGRSADEFERVLDELEKDGMNGLILDLRYNTGGLLDTAIHITDKFVDEGLIVSTRPKFGLWTYAHARKNTTHPNYPLVVLINSASASASEIVAGALQDRKYKRAVLVGERTHGKGSVQSITSHPNGGAQLKFTTAYYHLPSGQRVESKSEMKKQNRDDWGVGPDIEIKLRTDEGEKLYDLRRDNEVLVKADHDNEAKPQKRHSAEEVLASDPQLAVGVLVVKTKLIEQQVVK
ncbi:MAG: S41 family peptidase [Planctomycetota bacterium]